MKNPNTVTPQSSEYFLIKNSLLRALSASAVNLYSNRSRLAGAGAGLRSPVEGEAGRSAGYLSSVTVSPTVAVAELLAVFGSNVAALTVAVMFHEQADVSPPLAQGRAQEKFRVGFSRPYLTVDA